jgi:hypothetical protein
MLQRTAENGGTDFSICAWRVVAPPVRFVRTSSFANSLCGHFRSEIAPSPSRKRVSWQKAGPRNRETHERQDPDHELGVRRFPARLPPIPVPVNLGPQHALLRRAPAHGDARQRCTRSATRRGVRNRPRKRTAPRRMDDAVLMLNRWSEQDCTATSPHTLRLIKLLRQLSSDLAMKTTRPTSHQVRVIKWWRLQSVHAMRTPVAPHTSS